MADFVYLFSEMDRIEKKTGGNDWDKIKGLVGGKGAGLSRMTQLGLPVPAGFSISTEACNEFMKRGDFPAGLWDAVLKALAEVEKKSGKKFGANENALFLSCRSGAKISMPGMMDTVLNIGLHDGNVASFSKATNDRFVADAYRRLIQGFGAIVLGVADEHFEEPLKDLKKSKNYHSDLDMTADDLRSLQVKFKEVIKQHGHEFPQDPLKQLEASVRAVFRSWNGKRAVDYRNMTGIPHDLGTAVNIQTMVFGNLGNDSATGVAFTRNPGNGERKFYGDYLTNAQGEDVVSGIRNCTPVGDMGKEFPDAFQELLKIASTLENWFKNMQDIEFTIEKKKLYMLQCRDGKRTAKAQVVIAVDMVNEGLISKEEAIQRISPNDISQLLLPQLDQVAVNKAKTAGRNFAKGVNASPGGAVGRIYFDADTAEEMKNKGQDVILVRPFTKPEDVHGFFAAKGVLTAEGGATSHAAVVARQFGIPCIVGASTLVIDLKHRLFTIAGRPDLVVKEGDVIALDASEGIAYLGSIPTVEAHFTEQKELQTILGWADDVCASGVLPRGTKGENMPGLQVWANADSPLEARRSREFGAKGIGLCRTEHMFFEPQRLPIVQEMILAKDDNIRKFALDRLLPFQRSDFEKIFEEMDGLPVIVRLLDPPLHEFLPDYKALLHEINDLKLKAVTDPKAKAALPAKEDLLAAVESMHESNPMMGLRGVRVGVMVPAIIDMQVRAILEAAINVNRRGKVAKPYIMIPLTSHVNELKNIKLECEKIVATVFAEQHITVDYKFGTMIETPRAALTAGQISEVAQFFSFGTNDLTQMTFGISRDDAERAFLLEYVQKRILPSNPFQTLDVDGVGKLVAMATKDGRTTRGDLSVGICGEVGGDPATIRAVHRFGLTYVSCSTFRVPIARLGAALAVMAARKEQQSK